MTRKLSTLLTETFSADTPKTSFGELVSAFDTQGIAFTLIILSLPSALPIPAVGYSTVIAVPLFLVGVALLLGRQQVWLPEFIRRKHFEPAKLSGFVGKMTSAVEMVEKISKPRLEWLCTGTAMRLVGLFICFLAISMALPIPLTNTLPAGGIFLLGFSFIEKDGLLTVLGFLWSLAALAVTCTVIILGAEGVALIKGLVS